MLKQCRWNQHNYLNSNYMFSLDVLVSPWCLPHTKVFVLISKQDFSSHKGFLTSKYDITYFDVFDKTYNIINFGE